jgi:hydrogenase expression/formation protein HypE
MHQLIERMFKRGFGDLALQADHDAAVLDTTTSGRLAFTTDSFVVHPLFFPGGDIGRLAVFGTVNDLAMSGARPRVLSAGFILEEGLPMETLWRVVSSMRDAAREADVRIVTGDTKVVDRGKGDGLFINTSGIGFFDHDRTVHPRRVRPGDVVITNGDLGRHGIAIMAVREGLAFESTIESDCAPLSHLIEALLKSGIQVRCARDLTRGGLAGALNEIAGGAGVGIEVDERLIPVREDVRGACEVLGLDPLYVANEGRMVVFVPPDQEEEALSLLRARPHGEGACRIGRVRATPPGGVHLISTIGIARILDTLTGDLLPRIC